jgi:hypothetical protein
LRWDVWGGFDPTGFEGYAEPPMNQGGGQNPVKTKAYIRRSRPEPSSIPYGRPEEVSSTALRLVEQGMTS